MTPREFDDARLREAFALSETAPAARDECPPPETLWESAREELGERQNREVVLHLAACAACATSWRLARDLAGERVVAMQEPRRSRLRGWVPLASAAALAVAALLMPRWDASRDLDAFRWRAEGSDWLEPAAAAPSALPRDRFLLRWNPGPPGTTYDVRATTVDLAPVARRLRTDRAEFEVPAAALAPLPRGARILWQVVAYLPDGRVCDSKTFITEVE